MNEGQIIRTLTAGNRWWRDSQWQRDDRDLRALSSSALRYQPSPLSGIAPDGLYVLRGPRRVGKSLEIKRAIASLIASGVEPRAIIHFACDELVRGDLRRLFAAGREALTRGMEGPRWWFLDEITSVPDWPETIKWLRDNTAFGEDCVVLTGSSARDLANAQKQLAGRLGDATRSERLLLPMSFRGFAASVGIDDVPKPGPVRAQDFISDEVASSLTELLPWLDELLSIWELYLRVGGFPRAVSDHLAHGEVQQDFFQALWDVTAGEAVRGAGTTPGRVQALIGGLNEGLCSPLALESLRRRMGVDSPHTAKARLQDLVFAYLAWPCHKRQGNAPQLSAQSKYYFVDPLISTLAAQYGTGRDVVPDASKLTEQQLGLELLRNLEHDQPGSYTRFSDLMYMRTSSKEVDFCGPRLGEIGFEGKYVDTGWKREALTMRAAFGRGVLATRGPFDIDGDVWAVPAPLIAWMLSG